MNLKELRERGGFVASAPIPRDVEWKHFDEAGEEVTEKFIVHVAKQSFGDIERLYLGSDDRSKAATFISQCIRLGDGTERMTYEDAYQLDPGLAAVLVQAANEVNQTVKATPKN
jgi:hypothetical protein